MYVYTVQERDYDDYPIGGVRDTVGPFDNYDDAYYHGQRTYPRMYIHVSKLTAP